MIQKESSSRQTQLFFPYNIKFLPLRVLLLLAVMIYLSDIIAMLVIRYIPLPNYLDTSLLDGFIMLLMVIPGLYFFQLKPLVKQMEERNQKEKELIHTNELLEKVFLSVDTLIAYMDTGFNFVRVNDTYALSGGHPVEFYIGKNHFDLYPDAENQAIFNQVVQTGKPYSTLEKPFKYQDYPERGVTYWDWSLQPVIGVQGTIEGVVLSMVDVTERKSAELQLERRNQELLELSLTEHHQRELAERLFQATLTLNKSLDLDQVLCSILELIRKVIPYQGASILLREDKILRVASANGFEDYLDGSPQTGDSYLLEDYPLVQDVFRTLQPEIHHRTNEMDDWRTAPGLEWVQSHMISPLVAGGKIFGVVNLYGDLPGLFSTNAVDQLTAFATPAALALHNAQLYQDEMTARTVAETLRDAAYALTKSLDLNDVIDTTLDHIHEIVSSDTAGVTLIEDEVYVAVRVLRGYGKWADREPVPSFSVGGITDSVVRRLNTIQKSIVLSNPVSYPQQERLTPQDHIEKWLVVPIVASNKVLGILELGLAGNGEFSEESIHWVEALVGQAAVSIQNALLFQQVRSSSERLQFLTRELVEIQENERTHIARELHDEAGQTLSSLKLSLGRLKQDPGCPPHIRKELNNLQNLSDGVLEELHRLAMDLRPASLDHLGLVVAFEQYAKRLSSDRLSIQFKAVGFEGARLPRNIETSIYRILQEALTNVMRHAQASNVGILMEWNRNRLKIFVEDDGMGFDPNLLDNTDRLGLIGMRERAEILGGSLTIESSPGNGTSLILEVPDVSSDSNRR